MRHIFILAFALFFHPVHAQTLPDWENPAVLGIGKEAYHSTLTLPSLKQERGEVVSLDRMWYFHWSKDPQNRPMDFYKENFDASAWVLIAVPDNWHMHGYGLHIHTNSRYPFLRDQPRVTGKPPRHFFSYENRNPVGSYLTSFYVTEAMRDRHLYTIDANQLRQYEFIMEYNTNTL